MAGLFVHSGDPDQTPHAVVSDQGLQCLQITFLWVSSLKWVRNDFPCILYTFFQMFCRPNVWSILGSCLAAFPNIQNKKRNGRLLTGEGIAPVT